MDEKNIRYQLRHAEIPKLQSRSDRRTSSSPSNLPRNREERAMHRGNDRRLGYPHTSAVVSPVMSSVRNSGRPGQTRSFGLFGRCTRSLRNGRRNNAIQHSLWRRRGSTAARTRRVVRADNRGHRSSLVALLRAGYLPIHTGLQRSLRLPG
jgi:hypothetical protein